MSLNARFLEAALLSFAVLAQDAPEGECEVTGECTKVPKAPYFWPMARGPIGSHSTSPYKGPRNLSTSLKWKWNRHAGRFRYNGNGANLIDDERNIYTHFGLHIVKFSPNGDILWIYDGSANGDILLAGNDIPALYEGLLYSVSTNGHIFAIRMDTGRLAWKSSVCSWESKMPAYSPDCRCDSIGGDIGAIGVSRGIVTAKTHRPPNDGSCKAAGLNASTGEFLWDYAADKQIWNYYPIFTDDGGSFIFQDSQGGVYRLGLDGKVIWTAGLATDKAHGQTWTDGGVQIGPNGVVYAMKASGHNKGPGIVRAFRVSTGEPLWQSDHIPEAPNAWPVVGRMRQGDPLTVIAASGYAGSSPDPIPSIIGAFYWVVLKFFGPEFSIWLSAPLWKLHQLLGDHAAMVPGLRVAPSQAEVWGFDAETGNTLWKWLPRAWNQAFFRGEHERGFKGEDRCMPNPVGNPSMDSDGNLFIGVLDGFVYHLTRAEHGPGVVVQSKYDAGDSFSNGGVSMAPGMLVICSCENLMVFRAEES